MIYTVTLNPSLDYVISLDTFVQGGISKSRQESIYSGGKGIHISLVLKSLGIRNCALGFLAGFTGVYLEKELHQKGCKTDFVFLSEGITRINVKIRAEEESEIDTNGPAILPEEMEKLFHRLSSLTDGDYLILSGSVPKTLPQNFYIQILEYLKEKKVSVLVDAAGETLVSTLEYHPFLIKPNHHEVAELAGEELYTKEDYIKQGKRLQEMGAKNVLISLAAQGALLITEKKKIFSLESPKGILVNSVGAGDAMIAGFLAGYLNTNSFEEAFRLSLAAGTATAFSPSLATGEEIEKMLAQVGKSICL